MRITGSTDSMDAEPDPSLKLQPWPVVQEDMLKLLRTPAFLDANIVMTHSPQLLQTMPAGAQMTSMAHFTATTGEVLVGAAKNRKLYVWTLNNANKKLANMDPHQSLKAVGEIKCMTFIPQKRNFIGYCRDKTLRVFMDPVTGCEDIAYLTVNHAISCILYNKDTNELVCGGMGFLETYEIEGSEFRTKLKKGKRLNIDVQKDEEVKDLKLDTRNKQIMALSDKGINVVNYKNGKHTHVLVNRHSGSLTCCCIYHEGEFLVTGSSEGDLKIWNSVVYTQVHEFPGHIESVTAITCLPRDPVLFSSSTDGTLYVWRMDTFQKFMKLDIGEPIINMKLLKDGTLLAQTPMEMMTYSLKQFYSTYATVNADIVKMSRMRCLGYQPNKVLVSSEDGRLQMYNSVTGILVSTMLPLPKTQVIQEFAFSGLDDKLYIVLREGQVLVLNAMKNPFRPVELLLPPEPQFHVTSLAIMAVSFGSSSHGNKEDIVIFMGSLSGLICVLESQSVVMETAQQAHQGAVVSLQSSCAVDAANFCLKKTSRFLLSAGMDNLVKVWGLEFEPGMGGWSLGLALLQNIDCMGSPSHIAMFENIICVAFGEYGLVKMFRLAGLTKAEHTSELQGLYVLLTHFSQFDHSDTVMALDMCPVAGLFVTCARDGCVKLWNTNNQLVREMSFGQPVNSVCFANDRGDLLIGFQNRILLVPITKYLPQYYMEKMSSKMFQDDTKENAVELNTKKKRLWFDPKTVPKYSTDLVTRMAQKVKLKATLMDDDDFGLERMRSDLSTDSGLGSASIVDSRPSLTRENTSLSLNDALQREKSNEELSSAGTGSGRDVASGRGGKRKSRGRKRPLDLDDKDLRKISIGEALAEEDEEESMPTSKELRLAREDSLLYFRKPSIWLHGKELTPSTIRDLEMTAKATRIAEALLPDYLRPSTDEVIPITPEPKKGPEYTPEQLKMLTPWERFLLTKKPIIAPDGYIPNSVVRKQIGYVSPPSPSLEWKLKPVPDSDPRHLPEGWKAARQRSRFGAFGSPQDPDVDIDNIMDMKRANTLQSVKIQQSIKEASLYVGTSMCLLPDGTEPDGVPNFLWRSDKDEVADLTPLARPRSEDFTPVKEVSMVTPIFRKSTDGDGTTPKFEAKTVTKPLKKVDIDLASGLSMDLPPMTRGPQRGVGSRMPAPLEMEKSRSFRLSQAVSREDTMLDPPQEEAEKNQSSEGAPSDHSPVPTEVSEATKSSTSKPEAQKMNKKPNTEMEERNKRKAEERMAKGRAKKQPIVAPAKKLTKDEELTLLQKIVKEEWFPPGVPPLLDVVNDELTKLLDSTDSKIFTAICDYLVQIFQQLSITAKFLNRASDKLAKQLTSPSGIIRKKATWTMKQLGLKAKKEALSAILPGLLDAKGETQEELISTLGDMMGGGKEGLTKLMTSLGITNAKGLSSKEDQQAAIKMISAKLQSDAERLKLGSGEGSRQRMEMWVSSLNLPQDVNALRSGGNNSRPMDSTLGSRGLDAEASFLSDVSSKHSRTSGRGARSSKGKKLTKTRKKGRRKQGVKAEGQGDTDTEKSEGMSMDMSVQTDPEDDVSSEGGRRRGRWRRGGVSHFREGADGDENTTDDNVDEGYEEEGEDGESGGGGGGQAEVGRVGGGGEDVKAEGGEAVTDGNLRTDSGQFVVLDFDYTPNMFRSETGGSEWSDEFPASGSTVTAPGRPKGASVHKFYERRDHVAVVAGQPGGSAFFKMPSIVEPNTKGHPDNDESDLDLESVYTTGGQLKIQDGVSVGDSGICRDFASDISSNIYPGSDSLYDQGRPRLSPIKSHSNLKDRKEPEWKSFFDTDKVQERRKAQEAKKDNNTSNNGNNNTNNKNNVTGTVLEDGALVRMPTLPPIMYLNPGQPTLPGEAGLRLLHHIRLADKDELRGQETAIGHLVAPLPGRLTISTQDQPSGDTNYGLLQMHWTTQIPKLTLDSAQTDRRTDRRRDVTEKRHAVTERLETVTEQPALPRLQRTETTLQRKQDPIQLVARDRPLPVLVRREKTDFQWSKPMAPPPKRASLIQSRSSRNLPHCPNYKWAAKKMHHFISSKTGVHLPKMEDRASTFVTSSYHDDVMSIITHSSVGLVSGMNLDKLFSTMNLSSSSS